MGTERQAPHTLAMAEALARAPSHGGWLHLPDLPVEYRGPVDLPFEPFGTSGLDRPTLDSLGAAIARWPDRVAYDDLAGPLTFRDLGIAVDRLAARLAGAAAGPVGLLMPVGAGSAIGLLACFAAGRPVVLLDAAQAPARNALLLARAGADAVLGPAALLEPHAALPCVALEAAFATGHAPAPRGPGLGMDDPAVIVCTSGSTGEPKMLAYSQRGLLQQLRMVLDGTHVSHRDRMLLLMALPTVTGPIALLVVLVGCAVDLLALNEVGIAGLRTRLRTHPPTILRAGPSLLRTIAALPDAAAMFSTLRALRISGEPLLRADLDLLRSCLPAECLVFNRYGSTELIGTSWVPRRDDDHDPVRVAAGLPDPDVEVKIADAAGAACPPGTPGELWMRGRYAALGEWTADGLVPGRLERDGDDPSLRIHRTGDLALLTPDGVLVVLGRIDRMVKVNGHRVELAEVEAALRRSPEIREAAVVAREAGGRVTLCAFVVAAPDAPPGIELRLRQALRAALPAYMQPARIEVLDALPLLPGGKLDERALLARIE
jgi:acyl-coenzyme A synthetase/AMP-(fatty) acid ligase